MSQWWKVTAWIAIGVDLLASLAFFLGWQKTGIALLAFSSVGLRAVPH